MEPFVAAAAPAPDSGQDEEVLGRPHSGRGEPCWMCGKATTVPGRSERSFPRSVWNKREPEDAPLLVIQVGKRAVSRGRQGIPGQGNVSWPCVAWQPFRRLAQNWPTKAPGEPLE